MTQTPAERAAAEAAWSAGCERKAVAAELVGNVGAAALWRAAARVAERMGAQAQDVVHVEQVASVQGKRPPSPRA